MYLKYWGLKEKPFELTPNAKYLYCSRTHEEAMIRLFYTVHDLKGTMLLSGGPGSGKTLLSRILLNELKDSNYEVAFVTNPRLKANELLEEIVFQLGGGRLNNMSRIHLIRNSSEVIRQNSILGKETVLVIDEAQSINDLECFEQLRLLLNFQKNDRFLMTLIIIGTPEIYGKLELLPLFKQRIAAHYHIGLLDERDTFLYIEHRMKIAGAYYSIFEDTAKELIYKYSQGIPRNINRIADSALLLGLTKQQKTIEEWLINLVIQNKETIIIDAMQYT